MGLQKSLFQLSNNWNTILQDAILEQSLIDYESYSRLALFHPEVGYYASDNKRVGKSEDSDFYTSTSHEQVFPELMADAFRFLCESHQLDTDALYEIGAEPEQNQWKDTKLPCLDHKVLRLGNPFEIGNKAIVYSNELFDAQPFQRWISIEGKWTPVSLELKNGSLTESVQSRALTENEEIILAKLPPAPPFEYHFDVSLEAVKLLSNILASDWKGLFVAIDYGKTWEQLLGETPQGTARAFSKHQQSPVLHHSPGEIDLTTDVCWDLLSDKLKESHFEDIKLTSQSRFLMENAKSKIEEIVTASNNLTDKRKSQLLELITPGFFGQRFQVLTAIRR